MQTDSYRTWCPPDGSVRVEFGMELPRELAASGRDLTGTLYGTANGRQVRVQAAVPDPQPDEPAGEGMAAVGIFAYRLRGEVFLTESDLERFEASEAQVALVIAGQRGGFFARQADGSLQTIRSHQEFPVATVGKTSGRVPASRLWREGAVAGVLLAVALGALVGVLDVLLQAPAPFHLEGRERGTQVVLSWNPRADIEGAQLEFLEGGQRTVAALQPRQSSATYAGHGRDIRITLRGRSGPAEGLTVRIPEADGVEVKPAESGARDAVAGLEGEAENLRQSLLAKQARIQALSRSLERILATPRR